MTKKALLPRKSPDEIATDEELRRELRAAILDDDTARRTALEARRNEIYTPEKRVRADAVRRKKETDELETWKRYEADPLLMSEYLAKREAQNGKANAEKRARDAEHRLSVKQQNEENGATPKLLAERFKRTPGQIRRHLQAARRAGIIQVTDYLSPVEVAAFEAFLSEPGRMRKQKQKRPI